MFGAVSERIFVVSTHVLGVLGLLSAPCYRQHLPVWLRPLVRGTSIACTALADSSQVPAALR
jgi:hypothetical protein